jgi:hypothetical protein
MIIMNLDVNDLKNLWTPKLIWKAANLTLPER